MTISSTVKEIEELGTILEVSVNSIRAYLDGADINEVIPGFDQALDEAQGSVFTGSESRSYVVLKIVPEPNEARNE